MPFPSTAYLNTTTIELTENYDVLKFVNDKKCHLAVTHEIQIIGEAAQRIDKEFQLKHPEIPWEKIVGMRHKIVHDYLDIDLEIVWDVVVKDLPTLKSQIQALLP